MAEVAAVRMSFPGGRRVVATIGAHSILTDQPIEAGGDDEAMAPYSLFLASIGACAGFFVLRFCQSREISMEGIEVTATPRKGDDGDLADVDIQLRVPPDFPERYHAALIRSVEQCSVKRAIQAQPRFNVELVAQQIVD